MALTKITPQMFDTSAAGHDFNIDNGTFVVDASANRVGIGTATPNTLLDVNGALTATTIAGTLTTAAQTNITSVGILTGLNSSGSVVATQGGNLAELSYLGALELVRSGSNAFIDFKTTTSEDYDCRIQQDSNGLILVTGGQGSTATALTLDSSQNATFAGTIAATTSVTTADFRYSGGAGYLTYSLNQAATDTLNIRRYGTVQQQFTQYGVNFPSGKIGIGATNPNTNLQLYHATDDISINVNHGTGGSYPKKSGISFGATSTSLGGDATFTGGAGIQVTNTAATNNPTEMAFFTTSGGAPTTRMLINSDGEVGIGETNPQFPLHVKSSSTDIAKFESSGSYTFTRFSSSSRNWALSIGSGFSIYDETAGQTRLTVDSSGNLSSGPITSSGNITAGTRLISLADSVSNEGGHLLLRANTGGAKQYSVDVDTGNLFRIIAEDDNTGANGFVIASADGSGNFFISNQFNANPHTLTSGGGTKFFNNVGSLLAIARDSQTVIAANRSGSSPGTVMDFRMDGTIKGTLGVSSSGFIMNESGGNVGIGITDPETKLHISGGDPSIRLQAGASADARIDFEDSGGTVRWYSGYDVSSGNLVLAADESGFGGSNIIVMNDSGNVGIGTTSPAMPLDVGDTGSSSSVAGFRGGNNNQINIAHATNTGWGLLLTNSDGTNNSTYHHSSGGIDKSCAVVNVNNDSLHLGTNNTARLTIDSAGNVGIGTITPQRLFTLFNNDQPVFQITNNTSGGQSTRGFILYQQHGTTHTVYDNQGGGSGGLHRFFTAGTERFRISTTVTEGMLAAGAFGVNGINSTAAFHGVSNAALVLSTTNLSTSASSYGYAERGGRYLTSNGSGWTGDGKDPALVIGSSDSATNRVNVGIVLHNDHSNNNTFSPTISFGTKSNSTSYNTMYGYIMGRKVGQGVDANWSTGEIHMDTAGTRLGTSTRTAYMANIPAFMMDQHGDINMPYKAYAYGNMSGGTITPPSNGTGFALNTIRYQNCTPQTNASHGPGITITKAGFYILYGSILYDPAGTYIYIGWTVNGTMLHHFHSNHAISANHDAITSIGRYLSVGDHVTIENGTAGNTTITTMYGNAHSAWYIYKVG